MHSYTIQPMISLGGILAPRMLIVVQEKDGKFCPLVSQNLFQHPEIYVLPSSSSGKVNKQIFKD